MAEPEPFQPSAYQLAVRL